MKRRLYTFSQTAVGGMIISTVRLLILFLGLMGLLMFPFYSRPYPERIETMFHIDLPENARNLGWFNYSWDGYVTLARFTVDQADLPAALTPTGDPDCCRFTQCLSQPFRKHHMPDFYRDDSLTWWQPFTATEYEGLSCNRTPRSGLAPNQLIMVDFSVPGEATVYIEEYSVDADGHRALVD